MREILFRGKSVENKTWLYGYYSDEKCIDTDFPCVVPLTGTIAPKSWEVDPATVGQYTGLEDKNGKRIFEGDIVKTIALSNDHHQRGAIIVSPVEYWCGNACLSITLIQIYPFNVDHDIEVIGNIHDNPELLQEATP